MAETVVVADRLAPSGLKILREVPEFDVVETVGKGPEALRAAIAGAAALVVRSETKVTADLLKAAPNLRVIARAGVGTDNIDLEDATRRGIPVLTAPGGNSTSAAEHTFALLLSLLRRIPWAARALEEGKWDRKPFEGTELRGKTLGVLGLGRIGTQVARIGQGFGMTVIGFDAYVPAAHAQAMGVELLSLKEVLCSADILTLHLTLTDETRGLLDAERLSLCRKGAVLVNTARGALVDEKALAAALNSGHLGGAALDVFEPEPLPMDSPLRKAPNCLLTPHLGASTREAQQRVAVEIAEAVRDALVKGDLRAAVNLRGLAAAHVAAHRPRD